MKRKINLLALSMLFAAQSWASTTIIDFNEDPVVNGSFTNYGSAQWVASGGVGSATNAMDGYLQVTAASASQRSAIIFQDVDNGAVIQGFTFECDLRIGNGTASPADGFSISYARNNDPAIVAGDNYPMQNPATDGGIFAASPGCEDNLPEEGTKTGIAIGFDAWYSGGGTGCSSGTGPDVVGVSVRVDNTLVSEFPCPTLNGTCADATSLQTGPRDTSGTADNLCWAHLKVDLSTSGVLNVFWKGKQILTNYVAAGYYPSPGRLVFAGRTGDAYQFQQVDNIKITTIPAALALVGPATGLPDGFSASITDAGTTSVVNPASITATLNGSSAAPLTVTKAGNVTTVVYHGFPALLAVGSTNTVVLSVKDMNNNEVGATRTFIVPGYKTIPAADAVAGVDTTKVGFRIMPWQSGSQPNRLYWTEEQLIGLHGANDADLSLATDGGYIDFTGVINLNADVNTQQGSFQSGGGYPDSPFPGIPGANLLTGSAAIESLMFLKFPAAGLYTLAVNSDDGFRVTEGKNPKDRFAMVLGEYDGPKGASDVTFTVAVVAPGIYPVRLIWENGNGELPGNGANLEWFSITNGVKTLINDPSPANTTGIAAYYAGPALPAYVSHFYPPAGATGARADKLAAQITASGTTLAAGTVKLLVDGVQRATSVSQVGPTTTVEATFTPATLLTPGQRTAALVWSDSAGTAHSNQWSFTVANWITLDPALSVPLSSADTTTPGFSLQVAQVDPDLVRTGDGMANQVDSANALLGGCYFPWYSTNTVNTNTYPAPLHDNVWSWENPIDFSVIGSQGDFSWNQAMPGIPGVTGRSLNFAAWFKGYVAFTNAGYYRMGIMSDDGFRLSEGTGITRQVLHLYGSGVNRDVAAVVVSTNNSSFGPSLPLVPITGPVAYFSANNPCPIPPTNLAGKIAAINNTTCYDREYVAWAQDNGAIGVILINDAQWGMPYVLGGDNPPTPIHIPVVCVNGFGGEEDTYATNANLIATIGADAQLEIGSDDRGRGMGDGWREFGFVVPQPGLYPLHLLYEQGGGDAGLEWATAYSDTLAWDEVRRVLVQDTATPGSLNAYRALTVQPTPTIRVVKEGGVWKIYYTGTLVSSTTVKGTYGAVGGATSPYTIPTGSGPGMFYRSRF